MITFEESQAQLAALELSARPESVSLTDAASRVLAEDVRLDRDQPGFDRSTMDGYAVCLDGNRDRFDVVATILAGQTFEGTLAPGQAVRIMTGAPCPENVTVVPIELTDGGQDQVHITDAKALSPGRNIAWRGEDGHAGDVILRAGTRLGPANLSAAAMAGAKDLAVAIAPRVAIVTTGDEVGQGDSAASIHDSNGPLLEAFLRSLHCAIRRSHARDEEGALEKSLTQAKESSDVVVTTGGVSAGSRDLVPDTINRLGFETVFHKVAIQPGKPVLLARHPRGTIFLGLPGNPVSVLATAHLFLLPVLRKLLGQSSSAWRRLPLAIDWQHPGKRHLFLPAALDDAGIRPVRWNGSGDLLAAATGDGLVELPAGGSWTAGELISFLPFVGHTLGDRAVLPPRAER